MICQECHHLPSSRVTLGIGRCYCGCHDVADAAPVLLAACEGVLPILERMDTLQHLTPKFPELDAVRAAIAKAKGGAA